MEDKTPYKPPKIGHSPSDISKKSEYKKAFSEKVSLSPLYTHWFAIELAELHSSVDYDAVMVKMVVNGIKSEVSQEKLKNVCDHLQLVEIMSNARRGYFAGTCRPALGAAQRAGARRARQPPRRGDGRGIG